MDKEPTDKDRYEERISRLEKQLEEMNKLSSKKDEAASRVDAPKVDISADDLQVGGIVESVVGQFIPGLGGIIKALEKSSPEFRQKIAETDMEIKHRIDVGWSSKPVVDYHVTTRPMNRGRRMGTAPAQVPPSVQMPKNMPTKEPIVDVLDGKDDITVIAELPGVSEADLNTTLHDTILEIEAGQFSKKISLPSPAKSILERSYKNGILQLKLERMPK